MRQFASFAMGHLKGGAGQTLPGGQEASLEVSELVEAEQRMAAGAGEVAVVSRSLLITVGWGHRAVHVEDDDVRRLAIMNSVDPKSSQVGEIR